MQSKKKGKPSWKPATHLATFKKDPNYSYRYCEDIPDNIARKRQEQWEPCNPTTDRTVEQDTGARHGVDGALRHRELVLMRMPKETADARNAYFQEQANHQERSIKERLSQDLQGAGAEAHGSIIID